MQIFRHQLFKLKYINFKYFSLNISTTCPRRAYLLEHLSNRGLINVSGNESENYLQGLITNDMKHLKNSSSIFGLFLNNRGRILYDSIIYKNINNSNSYLIECDINILDELSKYLKIFRVRKKINITKNNDLNIWALFDSDIIDMKESQTPPPLDINKIKVQNDIIYCRDPRLAELGFRILIPKEAPPETIILSPFATKTSDGLYRLLRYKLGVGEGIEELTPGKALPLECNGDYLHGISFHKGCYIGQELTARTHHTGIIRKRLMPIFTKQEIEISLSMDAPIQGEASSSSVGKLKGFSKNVGLALLRINEALNAKALTLSDVEIETIRPAWWPQESPKEIKKI